MTIKYQISNIKYQINKFKKLLGYSPPSGAGQVVLMLVLITIVGLTIGLSLISRTVTDIRISSQIEQSGRAFSAAEAGVESALRASVIGGPPGSVTLPGANASYSVSTFGGNGSILNFPLTTVNTSQILWLIDHNSDDRTLNEISGNSYPVSSSFDVCWGTDPSVTPAILLTLFYRDAGGNYKIAKTAFDSNVTRSPADNFSPPDFGGIYCNNSKFRFKKTLSAQIDFNVPAAGKLLFLEIEPLYGDAIISFSPTTALPNQGKVITSVGQTDTGVVRKIQVSQGYNVLPPILDFGLFAEN